MASSPVMSSKGQLVIPAKLREELGLKAGVRVVFKKHGKGLLMESGAYEAMLALRGKYAGLGLEESFAEYRREERELEDRKQKALDEELRPDASAAVRYLTNGIGEEKVDALIHRSQKHEVHLLICVVNWGEALYVLAGMAGLGKAQTADLKTMSAFVELVAVDEALAESAATVKFHYKLGYADCFAASLRCA